jgi:DNA-binding MarR family transcriptional regulator
MGESRTNNLLGALVISINDSIRAATRSALTMQGETAAAIVTIGNNPGKSILWLSKVLHLSHPGTVRLLGKLVDDSLVERSRTAADGRTAALHLTPRGRQRMASILRARRKGIDQALNALSAQEQRQLCGLVERMLAGMSNDDIADTMCRLCEESVCPQDTCPVTQACAGQAISGSQS